MSMKFEKNINSEILNKINDAFDDVIVYDDKNILYSKDTSFEDLNKKYHEQLDKLIKFENLIQFELIIPDSEKGKM